VCVWRAANGTAKQWEPQRKSIVVRGLETGIELMGPGYFVIAIMGCADGGSQCTPVATLPTRYATAAECSVATAPALEGNTQFDFPTLLAQCRTGSEKTAVEGKTLRVIPASARRG